ncbi:hypothetical protein ACQ4WX_45250 [Streptomyces lasalocidi]
MAAGAADNYVANGQTVPVSGSGGISFLGAANNGPASGTATVTYTDGTTQSVPLAFSDWTLGAGSASPLADNTVAVTTSYRNQAGTSSDPTTTYVFATRPVALAAGKTVARRAAAVRRRLRRTARLRDRLRQPAEPYGTCRPVEQ